MYSTVFTRAPQGSHRDDPATGGHGEPRGISKATTGRRQRGALVQIEAGGRGEDLGVLHLGRRRGGDGELPCYLRLFRFLGLTKQRRASSGWSSPHGPFRVIAGHTTGGSPCARRVPPPVKLEGCQNQNKSYSYKLSWASHAKLLGAIYHAPGFCTTPNSCVSWKETKNHDRCKEALRFASRLPPPPLPNLLFSPLFLELAPCSRPTPYSTSCFFPLPLVPRTPHAHRS